MNKFNLIKFLPMQFPSEAKREIAYQFREGRLSEPVLEKFRRPRNAS